MAVILISKEAVLNRGGSFANQFPYYSGSCFVHSGLPHHRGQQKMSYSVMRDATVPSLHPDRQCVIVRDKEDPDFIAGFCDS